MSSNDSNNDQSFGSNPQNVAEEKKPFKCHSCTSKFANPKALLNHISTIHILGKIIKCSNCRETFSERWLLEKHVSSIHNVKESTKSLIRIISKSSLDERDENDQGKEKSNNSEKIDQEDLSVHERNKTIDLAQSKEESNDCQKIDKSIKENCTVYERDEKIDVDHDKASLVDYPKFSLELSSREELKDYIQSNEIHLRETSIEENHNVHERVIDHVGHEEKNLVDCPKCPAEFSSKDELERHIQSHEHKFHGKSNFPITIDKSQVDMTQFYKCKKCQKGFAMAVDLSHHNATVHEGRKLPQCKKCQKKFSTIPSLMYHLKEVHKVKMELHI